MKMNFVLAVLSLFLGSTDWLRADNEFRSSAVSRFAERLRIFLGDEWEIEHDAFSIKVRSKFLVAFADMGALQPLGLYDEAKKKELLSSSKGAYRSYICELRFAERSQWGEQAFLEPYQMKLSALAQIERGAKSREDYWAALKEYHRAECPRFHHRPWDIYAKDNHEYGEQIFFADEFIRVSKLKSVLARIFQSYPDVALPGHVF